MRVEYRIYEGVDRPIAGKMILRPETPEEQTALDIFRGKIASPQRGRKFEIIFRRRVVNAEEITKVLREAHKV